MTRRTSLGFAVVDFAEQILGLTLLPWQRWWLIHALELDGNGDFRFRTVLTLVGRQNGKTTLIMILALAMMYLGYARLVLGSAQSLDIAREAWQGAVDFTKSDPELAREVENIRYANGEQCLTLENGSRYRIAASTRSAGRGLSVDLLILDELREHQKWDAWAALSKTTIARPRALTVAISNAGDDQSVVLNSLRDSALEGKDESLAIFEWSAPDHCDLDDRRGWAQANPGLGHTITEQAIVAALATDPPATFRTEVLCQRVDVLDAPIDLLRWRYARDPEMTLDGLRTRVVLCLDVAPDLDHVTLAAAAVGSDGVVRVEIVAAWESTGAAWSDLDGWVQRVTPRATGWFPGGPAASLCADLRTVKRAVEIKSSEVSAVCQGLAEQVLAGRLIHPGDPLLDVQLAGVSKLYVGDGWRFTRRGTGHCDAVYAVAGAVHLARTLRPLRRPRIVVARAS